MADRRWRNGASKSLMSHIDDTFPTPKFYATLKLTDYPILNQAIEPACELPQWPNHSGAGIRN